MKQLTQKLKSGEMVVQDVPLPIVGKGMILVKNHYSIISSGTEASTVLAARKSLLGKAKERPQQVKQVFETLKNQGPIPTYRAVMKKLDSYSPLGYSCSGEVIKVGENVNSFKIGDKVACAGIGHANHAEIVSVPINLCVKLNQDVNLKEAAYNTLGAIAMQGVRQSKLKIGESAVIIGLGLLGQITSLILKSAGVKVIGVDISQEILDFNIKNKVCDFCFNRSAESIEDKINSITSGIGADSVIITAGTSSTDPINFAGSISRKRANVVVLGDIPTGFDRNPNWYKKELTLKMSCSYGPGRYDLNYEEKGIDYPIPYVRWTQNRNMLAFQDLISTKKISLEYITTHNFDFKDAPKAYDLIAKKSELFIGIALKYDFDKKHVKSKIIINSSKEINKKINLSFIGAGSYAQGSLLPNIPKSKQISKIGILTNKGTTSKRVAEKFGFQFCTSEEKEIFDTNTNTVFIATRHDSHADFVLKGLKNNNHVFVEKPLCLNNKELDKIIKVTAQTEKSIMVGFNRRFSPLTQKLKNKLKDGPMSMIYRVNAGKISQEHWIQDMQIGGGRIIGEVCHFVDYLTYINGSLPTNISAQVLPDPNSLNDTINLMIKFSNGSIGVICYFSNGSKSLSKEYIEIFSSGMTSIINDFKELIIYTKGSPSKTKLFNQNKGQKEMLSAYFNELINFGKSPINVSEIVAVTKSCFAALDSIRKNGSSINIDLS